MGGLGAKGVATTTPPMSHVVLIMGTLRKATPPPSIGMGMTLCRTNRLQSLDWLASDSSLALPSSRRNTWPQASPAPCACPRVPRSPRSQRYPRETWVIALDFVRDFGLMTCRETPRRASIRLQVTTRWSSASHGRGHPPAASHLYASVALTLPPPQMSLPSSFQAPDPCCRAFLLTLTLCDERLLRLWRWTARSLPARAWGSGRDVPAAVLCVR